MSYVGKNSVWMMDAFFGGPEWLDFPCDWSQIIDEMTNIDMEVENKVEPFS